MHILLVIDTILNNLLSQVGFMLLITFELLCVTLKLHWICYLEVVASKFHHAKPVWLLEYCLFKWVFVICGIQRKWDAFSGILMLTVQSSSCCPRCSLEFSVQLVHWGCPMSVQTVKFIMCFILKYRYRLRKTDRACFSISGVGNWFSQGVWWKTWTVVEGQ